MHVVDSEIYYRVDVPTMGQYQFWDTVICSLLKHMREKVAHVMAVCKILT